jgi:hypothetical protein
MATVTLRGPLFDGRAESILSQAIDEARRQLIDVTAMQFVRQEITVFRYNSGPPTYRYRSGLHTKHAGEVSRLLPSQSIPYVHWIEGTGSRNARSRFKGYQIFERTQRRVEGMMMDHFRRAIAHAVARI